MTELLAVAKKVLRVYLERGDAALAAFAADQLDEATALLRLRTAAFHNFRAIDARLAGEASPEAAAAVLSDPELQAMWECSRQQEKALAPALAAARAKTAHLMLKLRNARRKIHGYHSGTPDATKFEKTA